MNGARVLLLGVAALLVACGSGATNKAGGSRAPTVLTVAASDSSDQPSTPAILHFAAQVAKRSQGSLRIRIVFQAAGHLTPRVEERTIRLVESGRFDLGFVGARAWDEFGVTSFRALQAPFLITSTRLLDRVAQSDIAEEMLASLSSRDLVGLALVPDYLRHPMGLTHKLTSPADFKGARIRIQPSRVTAAIMRALGAVPVEISNARIGYAIGGRKVDGEELSLANAVSPATITGNVAFFGKALTLFANRSSLDRLSDDQLHSLRAAAAETVRHVAATYPTDAQITKLVCANRRLIVLASAADRAALVRLAQPVYRMLESDSQTRRFIGRIRALKRTTPPDPPLRLTASCRRAKPVASATGAPRPASLLDGTYRWVITVKDAHAFWGKSFVPTGLPAVNTAVLQNGTWRMAGPDHDHGTFTIRGERVRLVWPRIPSVNVFRFRRDADGTIHWTPVLPMDRGDQFVWGYKPWERIGPPSRLLR